ncbi:hypothetical protein FQR65_LT06435 [Abscondita terminalis]|nr:hypothetical protein FQR65_LT06435 [Abscondita terminalis]
MDNLRVAFQWKQVDFDYPSNETRQEAVNSREFVPENNLPLGLEVYQDRLFITVPRWKSGVPASLTYIKLTDPMDSPKLRPYPNWEAHKLPRSEGGDPPEIVSPFRLRADQCGRLWVLDTGVADTLGDTKIYTMPKLLIYDLDNDTLLRKYRFPKDQLSSESFLANIAVEDENCDDSYAYVGDVSQPGLLVYSWKKHTSWIIKHHYFNMEPLAGDFNVGGIAFSWEDGIFGIALSSPEADGSSTLYFHPMTGVHEFSVSTRVLKDPKLAENSFHEFKVLGSRGPKGQSSVSFLDKKTGVLFYSLVNLNAVACWRTTNPSYTMESQGRVFMSNVSMVFPNDIKVDANNNLWVLSDRLPIFMYSRLNESDVNFRILTAPVADAIRNTSCDSKLVISPNITSQIKQNLNMTTTETTQNKPGSAVYVYIYLETYIHMFAGNRGIIEIMYASAFTMAHLKAVMIILKRKQLMQVFDTLESGIFLPDLERGGESEKKLMYEWVIFLHKVFLLASPAGLITILSTYIIWKFTRYRYLPFGVFFTIVNTEITAFVQCIWFICMGQGYFGTDATIFIVYSHIKLHLKNLQSCLHNLIENSIADCLKDSNDIENIDGATVQWRYLQKRLKQIVLYHTAILDISKVVDEAFRFSHLVTFLCMSFIFCLLIYGVSRGESSVGLLWIQWFYLVTLTFIINLINYYGNDIMIYSENIADCCYNLEFIGTDTRFQKGLSLIIQRSQRPCLMTVGNFAPLSIATSFACLLASPAVVIGVICSYILWKFTKFLQLPFGLFFEIINVETTAIIQCIWFALVGSGYLVTDLTVFMVFSHIKLHLKNLEICIENILQNSITYRLNDTNNKAKVEEHTVEWKYLQKRLKQVVLYHIAILDVSKLVDETFRFSHLVTIISLSYVLCLLLYGLSRTSTSNEIFWIQCFYVIILTVPLNIVNYYGNEIILNSQNIANFCYNVDFIGTDIRFQNGLLLIIQMSQKPIVMTVGNFAPLSIATSIAVAHIRTLTIMLKRNQLIKVFDTLESGIFLPNIHRGGVEERALMYDWITSLNKLGLLAWPTVVIAAAGNYTVWIFTKVLQLPFGIFFEVINVEITAVIQSICFAITGFGYVGTDLTVFTVFSHIKLHLKNLEICIQNLLQNSITDCLTDTINKARVEDHTVEWKYLQKRLKQVVLYHIAILDVSKLVDETFKITHLVTIISLSYVLCLQLYGLSKTSISDGIFWIQCLDVIILTVPLNIVNYYGNEIILDSQNIANCCYNVDFIGTDIRFQKGLLLIIQKSQKPIVMTVGNFAPLSIATTIAMMKATYSYFMFLYNRH